MYIASVCAFAACACGRKGPVVPEKSTSLWKPVVTLSSFWLHPCCDFCCFFFFSFSCPSSCPHHKRLLVCPWLSASTHLIFTCSCWRCMCACLCACVCVCACCCWCKTTLGGKIPLSWRTLLRCCLCCRKVKKRPPLPRFLCFLQFW